jgi:PhoH-like ATPase
MQNKVYVLDTNVLLEDPEVIYRFEQACLGIPITVLEELDRLKVESTGRGANARLITRMLDALRDKGSLKDGVTLENGGRVQILFADDCAQKSQLSLNVADNKILMNAICLKEQGSDVVFVSKDINARVKADAIGIPSQDYLRGLVEKDNYYRGWQEIGVASEVIHHMKPEQLDELVSQYQFNVNEFVLLHSHGNHNNQKLLRYHGGGQFTEVKVPSVKWPITSKNIHQTMALDLLFDDDIKMVTLTGPAGTGKTFLTLLAGLYKVLMTGDYAKMMVTRSVVPLGNDIGYLPGDIQEKLHGWMQPIYDNVDMITNTIAQMRNFVGQGYFEEDEYNNRGKGQRRGGGSGRRMHRPSRKENYYNQAREFRSLDDLVEQRKMSLEAITYMRGRSIPNQFILIDEVQNLTPHEVKTLLSRVGEGTKIVLCGDPYQIDVPYLDFSTNGLIVATDRFKGQSLFGTVFMPKSERSELSRLVQELL